MTPVWEEVGLTAEEYRMICDTLGREPTHTELGMFGLMWSEHCSYKTSRRHLALLPQTGKRIIVGPGENAGVADLGDGYVVVWKIESHNHPSAIEPYQGAATGVGGILRDIFTMGARPIACLDSLRFGPIDDPERDRRVRYLVDGVVAGIAGYGNTTGIPTVAGEIYFDVMQDWVTPLLRSVVEDAVVTAMVRYTIDEAIQSTDTIPRHVEQLVQQKLDAIDSGIRVTKVQLVASTWPRQVDRAFEEFIAASQRSGMAISNARNYAEQTLTDAAGQVAETLYAALMAPDGDDGRQESLWTQVAGEAQNTLAQAQAQSTKVVEGAKANATYLMSILPEYRKWPELVVQGIYLDAIQKVLQNADEKFILEPATTSQGQEIRILVNRDQTLRPRQTP